jgi:hypothetical protein
MSYEADVMQWLQALPFGEDVEIDDEIVRLDVRPDGAVLCARLLSSYSHVQLQDALQCGFESALSWQAGLGLSADGNALVLDRWLPGVRDWTGAADALEELLEQLAEWREMMAPVVQEKKLHSVRDADRNEERLRRLFAGVSK